MRYYTVKYYDHEGSTLLKTASVKAESEKEAMAILEMVGTYKPLEAALAQDSDEYDCALRGLDE